ncbi:transcription factor [Ganoderma sinense ZZ0214-1]|uniref:Transcription factor n=1 Tax=Ganoderma sinense ZZ0214-1 TaxID=1077348 RepID=A0A2G8SDA7_9APHY|nr:transcription factor [Ganoderma sinense ZZ0214-1]
MTSTQWQHPKLPSVLPVVPAVQDVTTTAEQVNSGMARITNPTETPIYICAMDNCYRLFPSRDRVMAHRKRDHDTEDREEIITWNE